ncbi:MAG: peptidoglycan bridge formation glycyltransferase FemA/FemB family protein [Treponema sp.]|jgi:lipid II:glycine glycyltransferase (peptidoglycan interpeptide bridge formation enzyme)|nr:peptidoglycan bridge formation glycyltransferase FemA/FemB family protein [Treponema sp.]
MPFAGPRPLRAGPADPVLCDGAAAFLQSGFWGSFKARFGWEALPFRVLWEGGAETPLLVLTRSLAPGFGFAYVPWGPQLPLGIQMPPELPPPETFPAARRAPACGARILAGLAGILRPRLRRNTAFIRFDPPWYSRGPGAEAPFIGFPLVKAPSNVQAPDTVLIDLAPPPEKILAAMKAKWRYNTGLAEKRGVTVHRFFAAGHPAAELEQALALFYGLLRETAARDGIAIHGFEYYRGLFAHAAEYPSSLGTPRPDVRLYLAMYEGQTLAGIVTLFRGSEGVYLYGASSSQYRNLMAPYALQWTAIRDARESGCGHYDLFGIPPSPDPVHPMAGLYRFKTGFTGAEGIVHRPGSWDYPCRPLPARFFRIAEGLRKRLRDIKKRPPVFRAGGGKDSGPH